MARAQQRRRKRPERDAVSQNGCSHGGRTRYHDKQQATRALHLITSRGARRERTPCRAYQCDWCRGWFLTSKPA